MLPVYALSNGIELPLPLDDLLMLEVIPKLKLIDQGLVDVEKFEIVPLWVG